MGDEIQTVLYFFVPILCLWSIGFLITSPKLNTLVSVFVVWILGGVVMFVKYRFNRSGLTEYLQTIVVLINSGL